MRAVTIRHVEGSLMLARQRQAFILDRVREDGAVRVADLVRELGVSDMTSVATSRSSTSAACSRRSTVGRRRSPAPPCSSPASP